MSTSLFFSFVPSDGVLFDGLEKHLQAIDISKEITYWHARMAPPSVSWQEWRRQKVAQAQVIVCLLSADYLVQMQYEIKEILARQRAERVPVIAVLLRPVAIERSQFAGCRPLPTNEQSVVNWSNKDSAYIDIVAEIRKVVQSLTTVSEFQPKEQPDSSLLQSTTSSGFNVAVITAIDRERTSFIDFLKNNKIPFSRLTKDGRNYHEFTLEGHSGPVKALLAQPTDKGGPPAEALALDVLKQFTPELMLLVGVCGGFSDRITEGDVLVARHIYDYEPAKLQNGKIDLRPKPYSCSPKVLDLVSTLLAEGKFQAALADRRLHCKDLASGQKTISDDDATIRELLHSLSQDIYGFEQEGGGMLHAIWESSRTILTQVGIIKAVSDSGNAAMAEHKEWRQDVAAERAVQVAIELLRNFDYQRNAKRAL